MHVPAHVLPTPFFEELQEHEVTGWQRNVDELIDKESFTVSPGPVGDAVLLEEQGHDDEDLWGEFGNFPKPDGSDAAEPPP